MTPTPTLPTPVLSITLAPSPQPDMSAYNSLTYFGSWYANIHGYLSTCVCVFGIVTNIFNITVLSRKNMSTPVNNILTWLAVSDMITMVSYVPFALHFYILNNPTYITPEKNDWPWTVFMLFHLNLVNTTHTISIWLCVLLSILRYAHLRSPARGELIRVRRLKLSRAFIACVYVGSAIMMTPNFITKEIIEKNTSTSSVYIIRDTNIGNSDYWTTVLVKYWLYAITGKLLPCVLMLIFGSLLIYKIREKTRKRKHMMQISCTNRTRLSEHSRTTKMLLTVIVLFLATELPQGILIVLSITIPNIFDHIYVPLGDLMDILALVNNAINFVLYCSMSQKFRHTFIEVYCSCLCVRPEKEAGIPLRQKLDSYSNNNQV